MDDKTLAMAAELVDNYQPPAEARELLGRNHLTLVAGITGAGKNTIIEQLIATGRYHDLVTTVSRQPRANNGVMEVEAVDYYFVTPGGAIEMLREQRYVEVSLVHGRLYGLSLAELKRAEAEHKLPVADVDVQGVAKYRDLSPDVRVIFLVPPSYQAWLSRLSSRYDSEAEFLADWDNRRQSAVVEIETVLGDSRYQVVVNDDIDTTASLCQKIASDDINYDDQRARAVAREILAASL